MRNRSVLLAANYNAWPEVFNSQSYSFLNVVRQVEDADLMVPPAPHLRGRTQRPSFGYLGTELLHRTYSNLRRRVGRARYSSMAEVTVEKDYDLFVFVCQFPLELAALERLRGWRERSGKAVAFVLETWRDLLPEARGELKLLDAFDHVFLLNASTIRHVRGYTRAPCSFLATGADCLLSTPLPCPPPRTIDVFCMGRRPSAIHEQLVRMAADDDRFFYVYDTMRHGAITDWHQHRLLTASFIKRSRFFIAFDHAASMQDGIAKVHEEASLSTRFFEGAAGGAVMLGSPSKCPEFHECFDWPDAVIEVPTDVPDIGEVLGELNARPGFLQALAATNAIESLRRHDWAHRWRQILDTLGLAATPMLERRLARLAALADAPALQRAQGY